MKSLGFFYQLSVHSEELFDWHNWEFIVSLIVSSEGGGLST